MAAQHEEEQEQDGTTASVDSSSADRLPDESIISGAPRIGHKKSRNGCAQCKRRHVKCNEGKPCSNCVRHGVACSLAGGPNIPRDDLKSKRSPATESTTSRQGSTTDSDVFSGSEYRGSSPLRRLTQTLDRRRSGELEQAWMTDLQLMHHFDLHGAEFIDEPDWRIMLQQEMARLAFSAPYVMHILLGISALHLAHQQPERARILRMSAVSHLDQALFAWRQDDAPSCAENAEQRFSFSFMVCLFAYATPPSMAPIDALSEIFNLVRGVDIIASETFVWLASGPLAPMMNRSLHEVMRLSPDNGVTIPQGMELGVDHLDYLVTIEPLTPEDSQVLLAALADLKSIYRNVAAAGASTGAALVICWPKIECTAYCTMLKTRSPQALVVLAYYCVILDLLDHKWYMHGWGKSVLHNIIGHLDDRWKSWIQWPIRTILMKNAAPPSALSPFDDSSKMLF